MKLVGLTARAKDRKNTQKWTKLEINENSTEVICWKPSFMNILNPETYWQTQAIFT